jgi:hypothetical protein
MTGLAPKRQREDQDHTQEAIAKRAEYIVAELENLIRTDPGVREALAIASGKYSLDEKEAALMEVYQVLEEGCQHISGHSVKRHPSQPSRCRGSTIR